MNAFMMHDGNTFLYVITAITVNGCSFTFGVWGFADDL
jgi:hypothetical protein